MAQLDPEDGSEIVLLGCLVDEHLRLWRTDGRAECVRVLHPAALQSALAHGFAPRTSFEPGRFREVGHLDEAAGVLRIARRQFAVEPVDEPVVSDALWAGATEMLQAAATDAIARGEDLIVQPGGWRSAPEPYAVASARKSPGEWMLHVEAMPAPRAPSWPEPPEGHSGWGVAAPADKESLAAIGALLSDAATMWARSPLDVVLTFAKQADGPWPAPSAIDALLDEIRSEIEELQSTGSLSRARELSECTGVHFRDDAYPVYFTGQLRSRFVLVHHNPAARENGAAEYAAVIEYEGFQEYLQWHRRFGYYHWELGDEQPTPFDYKQMRFLRHWDVIDFVEAGTRDEERINVARSVDQKLQLELIPYGAPKLPPGALPDDAIAPYRERLMRVITAYPRDHVIFCGPRFEALLEPFIVEREDHRFRLPTSTGVSRVEYRFSNLTLAFDGGKIPVGLAPHFASPGIPMEAYGQMCRQLYRAISD